MDFDFIMDSMAECLDINITDDLLVEGNETFTVTLTLLTTDLGVVIENNMTVVTITDDEGILVMYSIIAVELLSLHTFSWHSVPPH